MYPTSYLRHKTLCRENYLLIRTQNEHQNDKERFAQEEVERGCIAIARGSSTNATNKE